MKIPYDCVKTCWLLIVIFVVQSDRIQLFFNHEKMAGHYNTDYFTTFWQVTLKFV